MSISQRVGMRLKQADFTQIAMAYVVLHVAVLVFGWPSRSADPNDTWFYLVQAKAALTAVLALGYGANAINRPRRDDPVFLLALLSLLMLSFPLEFLAFVTSFPPVPVFWAPLVHALSVPAYYALGLFLGWVLTQLNLLVLAPLAAVLLLVGAFFFDLWIGMTLVNPAAGALQLAPGHLGFLLALLALYGMMMMRRSKRMAPT